MDAAADLARHLFRKETHPDVAVWLSKLGAPSGSDARDLVRQYVYRRAGLEVLLQREDRLLPPDLARDPEAFRVVAIRLHAKGHEGHAGYRGALPEGLRFDMTRAAARARLGDPADEGGGRRAAPWDAWAREGYRLVVQYDVRGERVEVITLALPRSG